MLEQEVYQQYVNILREELIPALGCTEPIAIAFAAAKAREVLGCFPERIIASCSGNIVKNVKGVIVPATKGLRGIQASAVIGAVAGDASRGLEVLSGVNDRHLEQTAMLLERGICEERLLQTPAKLHIQIEMTAGEDSSFVEIIHTHTNIVCIRKNDEPLLELPYSQTEPLADTADRGVLNIEGIFDFANTVELGDVQGLLEQQISFNTAIAREGLAGTYGAGVGQTLLKAYGDDIKVRAKAFAAAGSDARMSGCEMPVIINSGSGNQGMTVSLPVIEYARALSVSEERLYRALCISNLVSIHQKSKIGRLSAYCGAVSAAAGAGAGIAYLHGCGVAEISDTIVNTLGNVSGIVCDGAKPSCAAKIASSVDAAILAFTMTMQGRRFCPGEGLIKEDIESTIDSISDMAKYGMRETDEQILKIMVEA